MFQIPKFWSRYLIQYKRDINENIVEKSPDHGKESKGQINPIFERLALSSTGYTVSSCWDNKINLLKSWQMLVSIIARINIYVLITMVKMYVSFIPKTEKYLKCFFFLTNFILAKFLYPFIIRGRCDLQLVQKYYRKNVNDMILILITATVMLIWSSI